jgi:type IV secretory pathway VirJ component
MRSAWRLCIVVIALFSAMPAKGDGPERDPFGPLHIFEPVGEMRGLVVLYSDAGGWDRDAATAATALARKGSLVVGVDLAQYRHRIDQNARRCAALVGDAEATSRDLQRARNYRDYHSPILAGIRVGGTLAGMILKSAPPATLAGAVSLDPGPVDDALCGTARADDGSKTLPGFWTIGLSARNSASTVQIEATDKSADVQHIPAKTSPAVALVDLISHHLDFSAPLTGVAKLPLIELPAPHQSPLLAIIISGDGGWRDLDKVIAEDLSRNAVPVVGWDSLRYFWSRRTPEEASRDLAAVIETYTRKWRAQKVALIGYSFGADVLPFLYDRLPSETKRRVSQISLLGLSGAADFEIKVSGWLGGSHSEASQPTQPALAPIDPALIQCFYGEKESDTLCPALASRGAETVRTAGGHHFDGDYAALARHIRAGFNARARQGSH